MDATTSNTKPAAIQWNRKKVWGAVGMTSYTEVVIGDNTYRFVLDQPRQGKWTARGWVNGSYFFYRQDGTLADMKREVTVKVAELRGGAK